MADATPLPVLGAKRPRADGGFLWESIVNGPVRSRRLGTSLGLNLIPAGTKLCSFDCPYCECGFNTAKGLGARWPSPDEVANVILFLSSREASGVNGAAIPITART